MAKGHTRYCAGSGAAREITTTNVTPTRLHYCAIFNVYTQFTNVARAAA